MSVDRESVELDITGDVPYHAIYTQVLTLKVPAVSFRHDLPGQGSFRKGQVILYGAERELTVSVLYSVAGSGKPPSGNVFNCVSGASEDNGIVYIQSGAHIAYKALIKFYALAPGKGQFVTLDHHITIKFHSPYDLIKAYPDCHVFKLSGPARSSRSDRSVNSICYHFIKIGFGTNYIEEALRIAKNSCHVRKDHVPAFFTGECHFFCSHLCHAIAAEHHIQFPCVSAFYVCQGYSELILGKVHTDRAAPFSFNDPRLLYDNAHTFTRAGLRVQNSVLSHVHQRDKVTDRVESACRSGFVHFNGEPADFLGTYYCP